MKKSLMLGAALAALLAGSAVAADLPLKARPIPAAAPASSWTGFYAGVNGGYGWGAGTHALSSTITSDYPDFGDDGDAFTTAGQTTLKSRGWFGGVQVGYNWQRGSTVFGLEADFQGASIKSSKDFALRANGEIFDGEVCRGPSCDDATALVQASSKLRAFATFRGRLGWLATPSWLLYGTGGLAIGQVKDTLTVVACDCDDSDPIERIVPLSARTITSDTAKLGYVVGAGAEYKFQSNWSMKAEYQFMDLGSNTLFVTSDNRGDHAEATATFRHRYHTARVGLNYHF